MTNALALVSDAYGGRGGIARAARDVIGAIASLEGMNTVMVLPRASVETPNGLPSNVRQLKPLAGRIGYSLCALGVAMRTAPEIIFCNHLYMAPLASLAARMVGAKFMIQLHGIECWAEPSPGQRKALERANLLICVSRDTRARILAHCNVDTERTAVVNNTVDASFTPGDVRAARRKFGMDDSFVLLTVGRLDSRERYKGHDRVIEALPRLNAAASRNVVYYICGTGNDKPRLKQLAQAMGVSDRVQFLDHVPLVDLPDLYRAADLFVLPSTGEGFGIVFLEAMACGTPAVGLAVGGAIDALGDGTLGHIIDLSADFVDSISAVMAAPQADPVNLAEMIHGRFGEASFRTRLDQLLRVHMLDPRTMTRSQVVTR